ncbi:MAG: alpha/beta hydrolase-fold protein [Sphingomonas sp.]|jgi:enterochelin esterase-like enzyme|uniref:alpha/beta hydrolase n=1 Tax=Sphingomonas sp. TaxID=28214 RepID=UPI003568235E
MRFTIALAPLLLTTGALAQDAKTGEVIGPSYTDAPEMAVNPSQPMGTLHGFVMLSQDSKIYPGIRQLQNETTAKRDAFGNRIAAKAELQSEPAPYRREVIVYIPAGYKAGTETPFMVVQDGRDYATRVALALDTLIAQKRVPPMVAVMIQSGGGDAQGSERGLEYDTVSGRYAEFVETEVLPLVARNYRIAFTKDPEGRATMGASSGAAAAFSMAWFHPEWYRRVLSYSGTFVNQQSPPDPATPEGAWDYHAHLIPESPKRPIRLWMHVGEKDLHFDDPESTFHNWPMANQRMAAALKAKGYAYHYVFAKDSVHVDQRVVGQTLPGAIEWLWQGYRK